MVTQSSIDSAHEILYRQLRIARHCDILVDRMAADESNATLADLDSVGETCPLADPLFEAMPDRSPMLVRLDFADLPRIESLLERALLEARQGHPTRYVCAFLFSPSPLARIARHLSAHLDARIESVGNVYLRYFDPRVWPHMMRLATLEQRRNLFGEIDAWLAVDWHAQLETYGPPQLPEQADVRATRKEYSLEQWRQIERIETINLCLQQLKRSGISALPDLAHADAVVAEAARLLSTQADQIAYSVRVIVEGRAFTQHPLLPGLVKLSQEHHIPLADVLAERLPHVQAVVPQPVQRPLTETF